MSFRYVRNMKLDRRKAYKIFCNTATPPDRELHNALDIYCDEDKTRTSIPFPNYMVYVMDEIPELNPCCEILSNGKASLCTIGLPEDVIVVVDEWPLPDHYSIPCVHSGCRGPAVLYKANALDRWQCACSGCHARTPLLDTHQRAFSHWCLIGFSENFYQTMPIVIAVEKPT